MSEYFFGNNLLNRTLLTTFFLIAFLFVRPKACGFMHVGSDINVASESEN